MCFKRKEKEREKENQPIKDWRKAKEKIEKERMENTERFFGPDNV